MLVVPDHKDVETHAVLTDTSKTNLSAFDCSFDDAGLAETFAKASLSMASFLSLPEYSPPPWILLLQRH